MVLPLKIMMRLYALIMILYKLYILGSRFKGLQLNIKYEQEPAVSRSIFWTEEV